MNRTRTLTLVAALVAAAAGLSVLRRLSGLPARGRRDRVIWSSDCGPLCGCEVFPDVDHDQGPDDLLEVWESVTDGRAHPVDAWVEREDDLLELWDAVRGLARPVEPTAPMPTGQAFLDTFPTPALLDDALTSRTVPINLAEWLRSEA